MPDSSDKNQPSKHKTLTNSLRLKSPNSVKTKQSVSNILNRLPFLRKLNETQNHLLSITPIWQQWCDQQVNSRITEFASLASLDDGVLTISCEQSSTATILKHQQNTLLEAINNAGFSDVLSLRIQMSLKQSYCEAKHCEPKESTQAYKQNLAASSESKWRKPSESSLKSIEATQALIKNEQLAASLKRLAETLKKAD